MKESITRHSPAIHPTMTVPARVCASGSQRGERTWMIAAAHCQPPTTIPSRIAARAYRPSKSVPARADSYIAGPARRVTKPMSVEMIWKMATPKRVRRTAVTVSPSPVRLL